MDDYVAEHLKTLYGLSPDVPHIAFQFPRLPPSISHPMFKTYQDPASEIFARDAKAASKKLQEFQQMYQKHASGLFAMNSRIIPPNHPMHTDRDSIEALKAENDKLLKENTELRKKLEKQTKN